MENVNDNSEMNNPFYQSKDIFLIKKSLQRAVVDAWGNLRAMRILVLGGKEFVSGIFDDVNTVVYANAESAINEGKLDFPDASFDYIIVFNVSEVAVEMTALVSEFSRILENGGSGLFFAATMLSLWRIDKKSPLKSIKTTSFWETRRKFIDEGFTLTAILRVLAFAPAIYSERIVLWEAKMPEFFKIGSGLWAINFKKNVLITPNKVSVFPLFAKPALET